MSRYIAVDLETTGVDSKQDYIVEVGLAGETPEGTYFEEAFSLDFPRGAMSPEAAKVNGWGYRQFAPIVTHEWAIKELTWRLEDVYLVGKVVSFDVAFLSEYFRDFGQKDYPMKFPWHHRTVDVGPLAWGWHTGAMVFPDGQPSCAELVTKPPNTDEVAKMVGIPRETIDGYHTALLDARWAYQVFRSIVPKEG